MELLKVENLYISEIINKEKVVVADINFFINSGEILGIVGESGSGKTVTSMSILNLLPPDLKISKGKIFFNKKNLLELNENELEHIRGNKISVIFQNPISSLNPLMRIGNQIGEVIKKHQNLSKFEIKIRVLNILQEVGFENPDILYNKFPHEISGGQGQRVGIAMAIANSPKIIIADEPTTALDRDVQEQILGILKRIQREYKTAIIFISHDIGIIKRITDRALVMYYGQIVETGKTDDIFQNPKHPYTQGLLDSLPENFKKGERIKVMKGSIPSLNDKIEGCFFSPRCPLVSEKCKNMRVKMSNLQDREVRCINYDMYEEKYYEK